MYVILNSNLKLYNNLIKMLKKSLIISILSVVPMIFGQEIMAPEIISID